MIEIRKVRSSDAPQIATYLTKIGGETDNLSFGSEGLMMSTESFRTFIGNADCYYVATDDGLIIGSAQLSPGRRRFSHKAELAITVVKEYWGKGVATHLFKALLAWAKANDIKKIDLEVRADNLRAISFYKKMGFVYEGKDLRMFMIDNKFYDGEYWGLLLD